MEFATYAASNQLHTSKLLVAGVGYAPKNPEVLRCPVCRREALIPGGTVLGFKTNMRLMKLLQMVKLRGEHKEGNVQCVGCAEQAKWVL